MRAWELSVTMVKKPNLFFSMGLDIFIDRFRGTRCVLIVPYLRDAPPVSIGSEATRT